MILGFLEIEIMVELRNGLKDKDYVILGCYEKVIIDGVYYVWW